MSGVPAPDSFPDQNPRERIGQGTRFDGRDIEFLNAVRIAVDVAEHRAEFLYWGYYEPAPWRNYLHTHSFFEICYAYAGRGTFRTGSSEHTVDAGTLFVARPGDVHEIVSSEDDPLGVHFWSYTLVPVPARSRPTATRGGAGPGREPSRAYGNDPRPRRSGDNGRALLDAFAGPTTPVLSRAAGRIPGLLEFLAREAAAPGPAFGDVLGALAGMLVVDTARAVVDDPALAPTTDPAAAQREERVARTMVRYLQDNFDRPVAVRDVAAQVHLSDRHAGRVFRTFTGTTIHGYLVKIRLEIAAQRLLARASPKTSITEIARACGYPDVRHFTTAFRRHWGVTPGAFRGGSGTAHLDRSADTR